ncbi:MAG TPA: glycosyl transferase family 1, partial [Micromonosporaceae bacterium]|nr:glycosyl transferase family 1 [Micromonosporaceae bacterium]
MPDRRLASAFTKRSNTASVTATSVGILSTYPPTHCGLANFTASLRNGLLADRPDMNVGVVRVGPDQASYPDTGVVYELATDVQVDNRTAARELNKFDVVVIQHEYGIYGGIDGDQVLDVLEWIRVPVIAVVHAVLSDPTPHQRFVLEMLTQSADAVVTMSETGRRRLLDDYRVEPRKIMLIPHGATVVADHFTRAVEKGRRPVILTWGLLGPGKGIEWGIEALRAMRKMRPQPRYIVAGQTHPRVLAKDDDSYRDSLMEQAEKLGVAHLVEFEPGYLSPERLRQLVREADVVLLPYDSREQLTSGVLSEAIASLTPVVATPFPHAAELLAAERSGLLVPHEDPTAIAEALTRLLTDPALAE